MNDNVFRNTDLAIYEPNPYFNEFVARHAEWTEATFGPGLRTKGITAHIRKELIEIENEPTKLEEWIDVILLALDGARRTGAKGTQIMQELERKLAVCQERVYPFPESEDHPSEHVRCPCDKVEIILHGDGSGSCIGTGCEGDI
jgi:hypothetical protein